MAPSAVAAQNLSACQLSGNANFSPGLGATSSPFTYSFSGTLSSCNSSQSGAPTSGTIEAGKAFGLPVATGSGGCASSMTSGISVVKWNDGKYTVVSYSTTGAAAAVALTGSVLKSVQQQTGVDSSGNPVYTTITTNEPATPVGDYVGGALAFQPPDPTACGPTGSGVTTAGISGLIGTGNYQ